MIDEKGHCKMRAFDKDGYEIFDNDSIQYNGGWISVKDALPEDSMPVLVLELAGDQYVAYIDLDNKWRESYTQELYFRPDEIAYWMPLPDAPEEGNDETD